MRPADPTQSATRQPATAQSPTAQSATGQSGSELITSEIALDHLSRSDFARMYFTRRATEMPTALAQEIQNALAANAMRSTRVLALMAFITSAILGLTILPTHTTATRLWLAAQVVEFVAINAVDVYLRRRRSKRTLTATVVNIGLFPFIVVKAVLWGALPALVGTNELGIYYLALIVVFTVCSIGFFWPIGHWPLSLLFAFTVVAIVNIVNFAFGVDEAIPFALLCVPMLACLIGISLLAARELVDSRGRSAIATHRQELISLLLRDYERGGHDFLWETDPDLRFSHVPPRMRLAAKGAVLVDEGARLTTLLSDDPHAVAAILNNEPFQSIIHIDGPDGVGELRLWGRPKMIGDACFGYTGVGSDLAASRQVANAELTSERLDAIVTVASGVAHDFNNQLATILGSLELLSFEPHLSDDGRLHIRHAIDSVLRSRRLTTDLTLASGHDATYQPAAFEIGDALRVVVADVAPLYPTIAIDVRIATPVRAYSDRSHFERAIRNLVENACQAMSTQGPHFTNCGAGSCNQPSVRANQTVRHHHDPASIPNPMVYSAEQPMVVIEATTADQHADVMAEIRVTDNGPGIPASLVDTLFEPYVTSRSGHGGTGLGLAVANGFARQAGGTLAMVPTPTGTSFKMLIPQPTHDNLAPECGAAEPAAASVARPSLAGHFLVVEDDQQVALTLREAIVLLGGTVEVVDSVGAATSRFAQQGTHIDCVICDLVLPDGEGFAVIDELRQRFPATSAIYVSGFSRTLPSAVEPRLRSPFVPKPFSTVELLDGLRRAGMNVNGLDPAPRAQTTPVPHQRPANDSAPTPATG